MSEQTAVQPLRILITGVSSGFGRALAGEAVAQGHNVVGTVRTEHDRAAFDAEFGERAHVELLDVTAFASCATVVQSIERKAGPIDVLVNNAGYGHEGTLEESTLDEMRLQFDVNVFGAVAMMQAVLPFMRTRRRGHIINITSMGGYITLPGLAFYTGSKFALEGISGSLAAEVADFGIKVTAVAPGGFRTDWAGRSMRRSERTIADYDEVFAPIRAGRLARHGNQIGDPRKAALVLLDLMLMPDPPVHVLLGSDAVDLVSAQLENTRRSILEYADLSRSTDAPLTQYRSSPIPATMSTRTASSSCSTQAPSANSS